MISEAEMLEQDAAHLADMHNGRVISAAFQLASLSCPNCNYPQNADTFNKILFSYTEARHNLWKSQKRKRWRILRARAVDFKCNTELLNNHPMPQSLAAGDDPLHLILENYYHAARGARQEVVQPNWEVDCFEYYEDRIYRLGKLLHTMMPCEECRKKYNPTGRLKHGRPMRFPQQKGILDE